MENLTYACLLVVSHLLVAASTTFIRFPDDFAWSVGSSAHQTEGAWKAGGKGEDAWDRWEHTRPEMIADHSTAEIACDSYHLYRSDIELLKQLGVKHYRISISWVRIFPDGIGKANRHGVRYYNKFIDSLLKAGIQPQVTLFHFEYPQKLQDQGGWLNSSSVGWFADYADFCFRTFGDRVKYWLTINEPHIIASTGYEVGAMPPGILDLKGENYYKVAKNLLLAHAKAYRIYETNYRDQQNGIVSIPLDSWYYMPLNKRPSDMAAAERGQQWEMGLFAHPIYSKHGGWPQMIIDAVAEKSTQEGRNVSRLPEFTQSEIDMIRGSADFFSLIYYTSRKAISGTPLFPRSARDAGYVASIDPSWKGSGTVWLYQVPSGFRGMLNWIVRNYGRRWPIYISENGISDNDGALDDDFRIKYLREHLIELIKAIKLDAIDVRGYTTWSLMDNFNLYGGYTEKFGLVNVNFSDPHRNRTKKKSFGWMKGIMEDNGLDIALSDFLTY